MGQAILRFHFRRQHRPGVDAVALCPKQPTPRAKDGAELTLGDLGHLADPIELVLVEPAQDVLGNPREQLHQMRRQERRLAPAGYQYWPESFLPPSRPAAQPPRFQPPYSRRRLRHQLVHRSAHRQRETEPRVGVPADPFRDVHEGAEESFSAGEVEKGVAVAARLDDRRINPKDLVQRAGDASVEPGIWRKQHEIGTELLCLAHQHPPCDSRRLGFRRKGEDRGPIGARWGDGEGPAPERGRDHPLDGGDEGRRVDEDDGSFRHLFG